MTIKHLNSKFRENPEAMVLFYKNLFQKIKLEKKYNFFTELYIEDVMKKIKDCNYWLKRKNKPLFGVPFFLKDNFTVNGKKVCAGSKILDNFVANFDATVYRLLDENGAILLGKTVMDELGMGGTGLEAKEGHVKNNLDQNRIVGGSSSGSVVSVSLQSATFAIGNDTGNSVRAPASYLGVIGFKPSFGLISRYGLIPFSPSLDTVGFFTHSVEDAKIISQILFQFDPKDFVMQKETKIVNSQKTLKQNQKILLLQLNDKLADPQNIQIFEDKIFTSLRKENFEVDYLKLPSEIVDNLLLTYQIISFSEALSSQANLTGINFGYENVNCKKLDFYQLIHTNRTVSFNEEIKRRYVLGSFFTEKENQERFYIKAMKFRTYLSNYFNKLFDDYDFIIHLSTFDVAPQIKDIIELKKKPLSKPQVTDFLLVANFLGLPSIALPLAEKNKMPFSINIFAQFNQDYALLNFAEILEKAIAFKKKKND